MRQVAASCAFLFCVAQVCPVHAMAMAPEWAYDAVMRLGAEGVVELPASGCRSFSREQLAAVVSRALKRIEATQTGSLVDEYGRISLVCMMDEVQWKVSKEQEEYALKRYKQALDWARKSAERLTHYSVKGSDRMEILRPSMELAEAKQKELQAAAQDYIQAKERTQWRYSMLAQDRARQEALLGSLPVFMADVVLLQKEFRQELSAFGVGQEAEARKGEAETKSSRNKELQALSQYKSAEGKAKRDQELLLRHSLQGDNDLYDVKSFKKKAESSQEIVQLAARDYAQAKVSAAWNRAVAGQEPAHQEAGMLAKPLPDEEDSSVVFEIMEEVAQSKAALQAWMVKEGYLDDAAVEECRASEEAEGKAAREQAEAALAKYRNRMENARRSLESLSNASVSGADEEAMKPLQEAAEKDQKEFQYAAHEYVRSWQKLQWFQSMSGRESYVGMTDFPEAGRILSEATGPRSLFLSEYFSTEYMDDEAAIDQLYSTQPVRDVPGRRFGVDGELRFDSGYSSGREGIGGRSRLRLRLYPDFNIDDNWHARGMIELEHSLSGRKGAQNDKLRLDRYYMEGNIGAVTVHAGVFGSKMAEGNIYDSRFKGVRAEGGDPVHYSVEYGSLNNGSHALDVTAFYKGNGYTAEAGYYHFDNIRGAARNIYMANYRMPLGMFDFGAMLLYGQDSRVGNGLGYIFSLSYEKGKMWQAGSSSYWLKYYRQPSSTYVSHTMNGMADLMSADAYPGRGGFRGIGLGVGYALHRDLYFEMEYYYLKDLATGVSSKTAWGALTGYFRTYKDEE